MPGFLIRTLITMLGLYLASVLVPGVQIAGLGTFILAAILLGFVNGFVRPVAFFLTLPITIVTLGLFLLVLNAAMFGLVGAMLSGFSIAGLGSAILGALIVSITSGIASWYIGPNGQIEVIVIRRD
ncbi:phage holin family protein [Gammaproteobacteria bacterium]|jgi:putative membrane protein|nr:phage holin family protein [Gammaproteobacteria bacterium]